MEIQYHLHGYGIPVEQLPVTDTGNIKRKNLIQWIRVRKFLETSRANKGGGSYIASDSESSYSALQMSSPIDCPNMNDAIFRGKHAYLSHPGNAMFRGLVESRYDEHSNATTDNKVALTWAIVEEVESKGGRFLIWDNHGCWSEMKDRAQIRMKVAGAMKDHKRRLKAQKNYQVSHSSTYEFGRQDNMNKKRKVAPEISSSDDVAIGCLDFSFG